MYRSARTASRSERQDRSTTTHNRLRGAGGYAPDALGANVSHIVLVAAPRS